jgi:hypothetical protein
MFTKKAEEILVKMDYCQSIMDQKASSKQDIKAVDLVIAKQTFSAKPIDSPKLEGPN